MSYAYDFSVVPGPASRVLKDAGAGGILVYSFGARQSDEYLDECRDLGLTVVWIWERNTDSIFGGYDYAKSECRLHEQSAKPGELTYVACDTNDGGVAGRDLTPFLRGWSETTREEVFGLYGSSGAIKQGQAFGGKCARWWGVVNWINGGGPNNAPENIAYWESVGAHLIQLIGSPIDNTDQNAILDPAWGSIGTTEDDDVKPVYISKKSDPALGIWVSDGMNKRHVLPDEWALVQYLDGGATPVVGLSDQWWDSIPTAGASSGVGAQGPRVLSGTFTGTAA